MNKKRTNKKSLAAVAVPAGHVPIGTILPYYGNLSQLPLGYLWCDGTVVPKNPAYMDLWTHLYTVNGGSSDPADPNKVTTPDLRGMFIRGWDYTGNIDPEEDTHKPKERKIGSIQSDEIRSHTHTLIGNWKEFVGGPHGEHQSVTGNADRNHTNPRTSGGNYIDKEKNLGRETRPINMAVNYIIKAQYV